METQIIPHAPQSRCYTCGDTRVGNICHHCGRAMCATHTPAAFNGSGKLLSLEFVRLGLKDTKCGEGPTHCDECVHVVRQPSYIPIAVGAALVVAGLFIPNMLLDIVFVLIGAGLVAYGYYSNRRRSAEILRSRPLLPLLPRFDSVQVQEAFDGQILLDPAGRYHVSASPVEGQLTIVATFGKPERDRFQQYVKKYKLGGGEDVTFHYGFAVLRGAAGLKFVGETAHPYPDNAGIPLTGHVSTQPFIGGANGRASGERRATWGYELLKKSSPPALPIRLVPSLIQEAAQRALEVEVQWSGLNPGQPRLNINRIETLELHVPLTWGKIEVMTGSALIGTAPSAEDAGRAVRTITWRRPPISEKERREGRHTFFVRFEHNIDLAGSVGGKVEVVFDNTLSGLRGVDLYYPLGGLREGEKSETRTHVRADFKLHLDGLRYQDVRIVPDPKKENDRGKPEVTTFEGVIPDHATVIALTNAVSENNFYVKRVIENPPRAGGRANVVNRLWDIAGRQYLGVYPIDFHLILGGEEVYSGEVRAQGGTTRITLTVQGTYTNPEMEARVEEVWERLNYLIAETLQQLPRAAPAAASEPTPPPTWRPPESNAPAENGERVERLTALRKRLNQLPDALLDGRLSEGRYLEIKAATEQEIKELQADA